MMNDENEKKDPTTESEEDTQRKQQRPSTTPRAQNNPDDAETVSIFDLMDDLDEADQAAAEAPTVTMHLPPADEAPTLTQSPLPEEATDPEPAPLPLTSSDLTPRQRPLESDLDATQVSPVAIPGDQPKENQEKRPPRRPSSPPAPLAGSPEPTIRQQPATPKPVPQPTARPARPVRQQAPPPPSRVAMPGQEVQPTPVRRSPARRDWGGCLIRGLLVGGALIVVMMMLSVTASVFAYRSVASGLPEIGELDEIASSFETARIYDRNGNEIFALSDPDSGRRTRVSLDEISDNLEWATIATEDARFYENSGYDPIGITRAIVQAVQEGEAVSGASTITQQVVRALVLDEEERAQRTIRRKVREIILADEMNNKYDKETILELYLNEIYYGNLAYGIEAAAQTYFNKSAADLTLAEASLLAGLPQAPAFWDPYTNPEGALIRQTQVLNQMIAEGYVTFEEAQAAQNETAVTIYQMTPPVAQQVQYPHFIFTVLQQAEELLGGQAIYRGGLRIFTTMDPAAQQLATTTVKNAQPAINAAGANNAAMVVLEPRSGEVLALVGSVDFGDETIDGQVNMALAPRQPGSSIKPLVYLSAFEQGWTPSTLIWDVPTSFPNGTNPPYQPKNYDDRFHGPLRLRPSLGNSYNIPAVKALEYVGVCEFIANVQKLGLTSLQDDGCLEVGAPRNYGLSLALGGGEISPLEMAGAYATLANQGNFIKPVTITRIENRQGDVQYEPTPVAENTQVVRPEHAYLLSDILSDNGARQPAFGLNNTLVIPGHRVAAKTGTSGSDRFDVRDGWTIGYTPEVVTAVWVGNTDNSPVGEGQSGTQMASPIWNRFMSQYLANRTPVDFIRPSGVIDVEICADSGTRPGPGCNQRLVERFAQDQPPLESNADFTQNVSLDLWTGLRANEHCAESVQAASFFDILVSGQPEVWERERFVAKQWLETTGAGQAWANARNIAIPLELPPDAECDENTPRPEIVISQPSGNAEVGGTIDIIGTVSGPGFNGYQVEYGLGENPGGWGLIQERRDTPVENGVLATWDTSAINAAGPVSVRVVMFGPDNPYDAEAGPTAVEERVVVIVLEPTATTTATPTNTPTATVTATPTVTASPTPTNAPTDVPTVLPTATPTAVGTSTPSPTPVITVEPVITETAVPTIDPLPTETATSEP